LSVPHPRALAAALLRGQLVKSWYAMLFQLPWLPEWSVRAKDGWVLRRVLAPIFGMSDSLVRDALALLREPGAATATINWYRAVRHSSHMKLPGRVSRPTLYVWSDRDAALSRAAAVRTGRWVDGPYRFEIFEGVSHWIPEERPAQTAALVLEHIAGSATR
jgi:pimeloyl-ACP methyl ester carboxylesterase